MSNIAALLQAAEYIEMHQRSLINWQELPDELILKILSYSELKDLISCGQVSKRTRNISRDSSLWVTANLEEKIVKSGFLEMILSKGCKILNLSNSNVVGTLSLNIKCQLTVLKLCWFTVSEVLLFSSYSLQHLEFQGLCLTSEMLGSICNLSKTLKILNLNHSLISNRLNYTVSNSNIQEIIKCCQGLEEFHLGYINENNGLKDEDVQFLARNVSSNLKKLDLSASDVLDDHVKILLSRCNKIEVLSLIETFINDDTITHIRQYLSLTLEEMSLSPYEGGISYIDCVGLKYMRRLKTLNFVYCKKKDEEEIQWVRQFLPHLMIKTSFEEGYWEKFKQNTN